MLAVDQYMAGILTGACQQPNTVALIAQPYCLSTTPYARYSATDWDGTVLHDSIGNRHSVASVGTGFAKTTESDAF
eukprot:239617-Rhodomonas_salina.1